MGQTQLVPDGDAMDVMCPSCGYDLRGSLGGDTIRCPECGTEVTLEELSRSRVPWMHRSTLGARRAWWRTCFMASRRPRDLVWSLNAPLPMADAKRFWWICVLLLSAASGCLAWQFLTPLTEGALAAMDPNRILVRPDWFLSNLVGPWAAGIYWRPVAIGAAILFPILAMGAISYLFQVTPGSRLRQDRAAAAGLYVAGTAIPGAIWGTLIAGIWCFCIWGASGWKIRYDWLNDVALFLSGSLFFAFLLAGITWLIAAWRTYCLTLRAGFLRGIVALAEIVGISLLMLGICLLLMPWAIGVFRILLSVWLR
jgi:hypothetical protein